MIVLGFSKINCLQIKWHLELAKLMTWGDSHLGVFQFLPSFRLPRRHSKAHCSHKDGENITWVWSLFFLHILSHMCSFKYDMLVTWNIKHTDRYMIMAISVLCSVNVLVPLTKLVCPKYLLSLHTGTALNPRSQVVKFENLDILDF